MAQSRRQHVGKWGEDQASLYLESKGYRIVARNVRTGYGEIDLIASNEFGLVFVEVKTRTNLKFGYPEQAVTGRKMEHMVSAAQAYISENPGRGDQSWRIDVIAIFKQEKSKNNVVEIMHFENVA